MSDTTEFNIADYELQDFGVCEINDKKGDPLKGPNGKQVTIELWGPGSEAAIAWENKQNKAITDRAMKQARGKAIEMDARKDMVSKLVAHTKSINNFPLTPEALYGNPKLAHIHDQAWRYMNDTGNF